MSEQKMSRQELYDEIKKSSKDAFILKEMKRLGFWDSTKPKVGSELIERKVVLQQELSKLSVKIKDPQKALKEIHQRRMKEALERREETKQRNEEKREQKVKERELKKENSIGFLGKEFVGDLKKAEYNEELLNQNGLFIIENAKDLAGKMGINLKDLRFLTYTQKLSPRKNYISFKIAKKSGGHRDISAPKPKLKKLQYWILENILNKIEVSQEAHGFVKERGIVSNASHHIQKSVVINCDLENFFPTLNFPRVRGLFVSLGYSWEVSTLLAMITTEAKSKEIELDTERLYLYTGERYLPQGSPASPMITNLICRKLDNRMRGIAKSLEFTYSRYADDMTFSASSYDNINKMLFWIKGIVKDEGFILHPKKTRIMKKGTRQEVTGVVVNEKLSINRKELKKFRALLFQIEQSGLEGKSWHGKSENLMLSIWGYANFINMVDSVKGEKYIRQLREIMKTYPLYSEAIAQEIEVTIPKKVVKTSFIDTILNMFRK